MAVPDRPDKAGVIMDNIKLTIELIPTADGRHDLTVEPEGISREEVPYLLEWVLLQIKLNKNKKLKLIK